MALAAPILEARDLTKRYALGETTVDALRGVSLTVQPGEFVALMGSSGSGKSTLLHLLGGLDRPTSGEVILRGETISGLDDDAATRLRRERTGFVFQFFNLIPLLDVSRERRPAVHDRRPGPAPRRGRRPDPRRLRARRPRAARSTTGPISSRPASSSGSPSPGPSSPGRRSSCSPTSRPATSTSRPAARSSRRSGDRAHERGQTIVLVTHDAKAAAYADRVVVIEDGVIRDEIVLGRRDDHTAAPLIARLAQLGL